METHLQVLAGELRRSVNLRVLVANDGWRNNEGAVDGVDVTRLGTAFTMAGAQICPRMAARIRAARADLVHIHLPNPTALLSYFLSGHKGRMVVTWHSDAIRQKTLSRLFEPFQRLVLRRCSALIASSPNYLASSRLLWQNRSRCHVIPHGIAVERVRRLEAVQVEAIRGRYGPRVVLSVGRLVYYKGIEYLIEAMGQVRGRLLVLGDGPLRGRIEMKIRSLGLEDRVELLGEVADAVPFYQACDVFVLPSIARSEAFGIVQLEAMACGKPVVNTQLPSGVPFVSVDGVTGITVTPGQPGPLADAINYLFDDPARGVAYGQAALRRVREEFSAEKMADRTLALYDRVMSGGRYAKVPPIDKPAETRKAEASAHVAA
jgi:rhamnosyl/mannosyltransferase